MPSRGAPNWGTGALHQRYARIATHLGVLSDLATVGIGKKLLCGQVDLRDLPANAPREVTHGGRVVGMSIKAKTRLARIDLLSQRFEP